MQKKIRETRGITLVALVITIIILLILAGVTISLLIGENGLIAKSKQSVEKYKDKAKEEQWQLEDFEAGMEEISLDELQDEEEHPELKSMKLELEITDDNKKIKLPMNKDTEYTYDCIVKWGDGTESTITTNEDVRNTTHTYSETGTYKVIIEGKCESLYVDYFDKSVKKSLIKVEQWGKTGLKEIDLSGCSNLTEIATPSRNSFINIEDFTNTFSSCTSLVKIPERLFANCPNVTNFRSTFLGCSSLTSIPERLFVNCSNVTGFYNTFSSCTGLVKIPERLFANCPKVTSFISTFSYCSSLTSIPERLFANCPNVTSFISTFSYCSSLTSIPERLFANCPNVTDFDSTFLSCSSLTNIPEKLFANCRRVTDFTYTFCDCINLTGKSIELWNDGREGIDENKGGFGRYAGCTKLDDYKTIPDYWKQRGPR